MNRKSNFNMNCRTNRPTHTIRSDEKMRIRTFAIIRRAGVLALLMFIQGAVFATGGADVLDVKARQTAPQTWHFSVTIAHPDTGWDHYVDGWDVVLPDGSVVKPAAGEQFTRTLVHPHVDEQPLPVHRAE